MLETQENVILGCKRIDNKKGGYAIVWDVLI